MRVERLATDHFAVVLANSAGWSLVGTIHVASWFCTILSCQVLQHAMTLSKTQGAKKIQKASITPSPWNLIGACYLLLLVQYCNTNEISTPAWPCGEKVTGFFLAGCVEMCWGHGFCWCVYAPSWPTYSDITFFHYAFFVTLQVYLSTIHQKKVH